jgi:hypothetical protein
MKELVDALVFTHQTDTTLTNLIAGAMQDCQYSIFADDIRKKIAILMKYHAQYGNLTVAQIRALGSVAPDTQS